MGFEFGDELIGGIELAGDVFQDRIALRSVGFLVCKMEICLHIGDSARKFFFRGDVGFGALALLENGLRLLLILPERRVVDFGFEGFQKFAACADVKDSSARVRCAS